MATDIDPSNLRAQLKDAFANADKNAAERVRQLQWVHQARASRLSRTVAELKAEHGADDPAVKRAEAETAAARAAAARLSMAHQQLATPDPEVAPGGWALHGRVYIADKKSDESKPVHGFTVFLVDAAKTYQETYGFAYTDDSGYFLLNYPGPAEASSGSGAAKDTAAAELFVEVADLKARPVYVDTTRPFTPVPGAAVYRIIELLGTEPLGRPPAGRKKAPAPKRKQEQKQKPKK
jgi:hypothetical protein